MFRTIKPRIITQMALIVTFCFAALGTTNSNAAVSSAKHDGESGDRSSGAVFVMTNATDKNEIVAYRRAQDGTLTRMEHAVPTRGLGIGVDTDTQGPLRLSKDHRFLYAVNPGSDNISVFEVKGAKLKFLQIVPAGDQPLSLTISGNLLYSLDGSVAGNGIRGFRIASDGTLTELPNSYRALSSAIAVPGEVSFSPDGRTLLVTHKTTNVLLSPQNAIDVFQVDVNGYASAVPLRNESFGLRPFGVAFREDGKFLAVESFNAMPNLSSTSSYQLNPDGSFSVISGAIGNLQTDSCWVVITNGGKYAFTSNFGSGTISSYSFSAAGGIQLLNGAAAFMGDASQPVDSSYVETPNGNFLYQLLRGPGAVAAFRIEADASLTALGTTVGGLPTNNGISGLAGY